MVQPVQNNSGWNLRQSAGSRRDSSRQNPGPAPTRHPAEESQEPSAHLFIIILILSVSWRNAMLSDIAKADSYQKDNRREAGKA